MKTSVVVVGQGPSAIATVRALVASGTRAPENILVIDDKGPMAQFGEHVEAIGMRDMRSPWTVSVEHSRTSLIDFAAERDPCEPTCCSRPSWATFLAHALSVWNQAKPSTMQARVVGVSTTKAGWRAQTSTGEVVETPMLIIATGNAPHRVKPLANTIPLPDQAIPEEVTGTVAIVGSGMTASNAAFTLLERGAEQVFMFMPNGLVPNRVDTRAWFTGPYGDGGCISAGAQEARDVFLRYGTERRYQMLQEASIAGTITTDHREALFDLQRQGRVVVVEARATAVNQTGGKFEVTVAREANLPVFSTVYDARGFKPDYRNLGSIEGLPGIIGDVHYREFPLINDRTGEVQGRTGLYIAGGLSAMSFGPAADTVMSGVMLGEQMVQDLKRR